MKQSPDNRDFHITSTYVCSKNPLTSLVLGFRFITHSSRPDEILESAFTNAVDLKSRILRALVEKPFSQTPHCGGEGTRLCLGCGRAFIRIYKYIYIYTRTYIPVRIIHPELGQPTRVKRTLAPGNKGQPFFFFVNKKTKLFFN